MWDGKFVLMCRRGEPTWLCLSKNNRFINFVEGPKNVIGCVININESDGVSAFVLPTQVKTGQQLDKFIIQAIIRWPDGFCDDNLILGNSMKIWLMSMARGMEEIDVKDRAVTDWWWFKIWSMDVNWSLQMVTLLNDGLGEEGVGAAPAVKQWSHCSY